MKRGLIFLSFVCFISAPNLFAQSNSAAHQLIIVLPEIADLNISPMSVNNNISLNYKGAVIADSDYQKTRNLRIELLPNTILGSNQSLELIYSETADLSANHFSVSNQPFDLTFFPESTTSNIQETQIDIAYQLIGTPSFTSNVDNALEVVYTLSEL